MSGSFRRGPSAGFNLSLVIGGTRNRADLIEKRLIDSADNRLAFLGIFFFDCLGVGLAS